MELEFIFSIYRTAVIKPLNCHLWEYEKQHYNMNTSDRKLVKVCFIAIYSYGL
jgi:hypothetical protein